MTKTEERVYKWINQSDYDLETANVVYKTKRYLYVGFMCQQAIEKIFKAYYLKRTEKEPPYTHNLLLLAEKSDFYNLLTDGQQDLLDYVNVLYISTRYPEDKTALSQMLTQDKCAELLKQTKLIQQWTKEKILLIK
ncbi:DNA-binding protein [Bacteroidia bacterium]|nr:DNA-binding protein [Bacteroidia bacterium]